MNNIFGMINQIKQNPMSILGRRFNLPQNLNDPQQIIQHLMNTGQVSQAQYNQAQQILNNFKK